MSVLSTSTETDEHSSSCEGGLKSALSGISETVLARRPWQSMVDNSCLFRQSVLTRLERLSAGHLSVRDRSGSFSFGSNTSGFSGQIDVHNRRFYRSLVLGGSLGAAESYIRGDWDAADLTTTMRVLARNVPVLTGFEQGLTRILRPLRYAANLLRRNSPAQSKRNIAAHYDLSNDFFALMLDPTMTYSSGIFPTQDSTMEQASLEKYERICQQLELKPTDQLLEIGTGWGGFAEYAAQNYGCRVTTTTISQQQYEYAQNRFESAGLTDKITLLNVDYRDLTGKYDKLASIEMIEAVGEQYLRQYFAKCCQLLKSTGKLALQAITIPDYRYDDYRRSVDFIRTYIFPGGFLPCHAAISDSVRHETDFRLVYSEDFAEHYAETLSRWRAQFWHHIEKVRTLGFDERFLRTWHYYLCYCEAGFRERQIGLSQLAFARPSAGVRDE